MRASPLPVSDAFWIRLKDVVPSRRTPHNSPFEIGLPGRERRNRRSDRRVFGSPVEPGAGQQADRGPVQPGMHPVAVEFDFVQPLRPIGRLVDQLGELRFDPTG